MNPSQANRPALFALTALVMLWAFSWMVMKTVMRYAGPFEFAALRYLGGAAILLTVTLIRTRSLKPPPWRLTIAVGLCQTAAFQGLTQWALVAGGAGHVSLLAYTMPFWVVLLAWWLLGDRPSRRQWIGLALAAGGLVSVMQPWRGLGTLHSALLAVCGGIAWAMGTVLTKRMFQLHSPSPLSFTAWQMLIGGIALGIVALAVPSRPIDWSPVFIGGLAYSIIFASSMAWLLWSFVVDRLPATVAGLSSLAVPVSVVLLAWALLHEQPDGMEWIGVVLIVSGLLAISGIGWRKKRETSAEK